MGSYPARGHDLGAHDVGLRLRVAAVLQEDGVHPEAADDVDDLRGASWAGRGPGSRPARPGRPAPCRPWSRCWCRAGARRARSRGPGRPPPRLPSAPGQDAAVDVDEAAGQGEGVDVARVHDADLVGELGPGRLRGQPAEDGLDVALGVAVVEQRELPLRLDRRLASDLDVLLGREDVEPRLDLRGRRQGGDGGNQGRRTGGARPRRRPGSSNVAFACVLPSS